MPLRPPWFADSRCLVPFLQSPLQGMGSAAVQEASGAGGNSFDCFPLFLHFLTSLINLILWLRFLHRQNAGRGHGASGGRTIGPCSVSQSLSVDHCIVFRNHFPREFLPLESLPTVSCVVDLFSFFNRRDETAFYFYFLAVLGVCCCVGFSLVVANRGYTLVVVCGFLTAVAYPIAEHGL